MSDEATAPPAPPVNTAGDVEQPDTPEPPGEPRTFDAEYVKKLRQEAAKYRTEAKQAAAKASKFDEWEQAQKTELEKAQETIQKYEKELVEVRTGALRVKVAAGKGLPASLAERLRGTTEEEMEADADALLADMKPGSAPSKQQTGAGVTGKAVDYENMSVPDIQKLMAERSRGTFQARIG